jgi:hypothetical protein
MLMFAGLILWDLPDTVDWNKHGQGFAGKVGRRSRYGKCEKTDKIEATPRLDPFKLQIEHEAIGLLGFYIWYVLANTKESTLGEIMGKVNRKFNGLVSSKDVARVMVDHLQSRGDPFFCLVALGLKNRMAYFLRCTLRKKLISFEYSLRRPKTGLDLISNLERRRQRIKDVELETLLNPQLLCRANRESPWWDIYQRKLDNGECLARLTCLFPDEDAFRAYE